MADQPRDPETGQFVSPGSGETMRANEQFNQGLRLGLAARMGNLSTFGDEDDIRDTWGLA